VRLGYGDFLERGQQLRRALFQFSPQVFPLIPQLAVCFVQLNGDAMTRDFRAVKFVAASRGFVVHGFEEGRERGDGIFMRLKAAELRMMFVAPGFSAQDFLRQQRFAPKRDQAFGVEIFWVNSPQTHGDTETKPTGWGEF
jgi:hypothetical protein